MKLIDCDLEKQMILIESKRDNIKSARHILERALCQQFQLLTLAIYSSEILKGNKLKKHDFEEIKKCCVNLFPNDSINSYDSINEYISDGIYRQKWMVIGFSDLNNIEIRIIGKYVYLWNTIEINEQLAILGSDYRIYFAGSMQLVSSYVKSIIGYEDKTDSIDCRYIFGEIGNVSISLGGQVFDFINEISTSPFFNDNVPGFSIGDTAVVRRCVLKRMNQNDKSSYFHVLFHEITHTISYSYKDGSLFTLSNWNTFLKRDICRFLKKPHSIDEITKAFKIIIENPIKQVFKGLVDIERFDNLIEFSDILDTMVSDGIVTIDEQGNYLCVALQEGQPWDVF